jgi:hypothetical protein
VAAQVDQQIGTTGEKTGFRAELGEQGLCLGDSFRSRILEWTHRVIPSGLLALLA